jgi:TatD DNase family protein
MKLVDSHAHLTDEKFKDDLPAVLERAREAGVARVLNAGCDMADSEKAVALAASHEEIFAAVGIHPHEAKHARDEDFARLLEWAKHEKVLAIGETGLDYHYMHSPKEAQQELMRILDGEKGWLAGGVMHSFTGGEALARRAVENGWMISLSGIVTFPNASALREVVKKLPYENLLVETDCPYLAPVPERGKRNEPAFVRRTSEFLSTMLPLSPGDVARITTANFERLFRLSKRPEKDTYAYLIRNSMYLNVTSRCTNECVFCVREYIDGVSGYYLWLQKEPTVQELLEAVGDPKPYDELVFCGYGEPTLRLDVIKGAARELKARGAKRVRLTTDGHANLIHGRNVVPELAGLIDFVDVSIDAHDPESYEKICKPKFKGVDVFAEVVKFARECVRVLPQVELTTVAMPGVDVEKCREIARGMGAAFRAREYNVVG